MQTEGPMRQELLKGHLDGLVLALIAEQPLHGYSIKEALRDQSDGELDIEGGTLYPVLHRLEAAGLISGKWSVHAGRRRRTYSLTAKGTVALVDTRRTWRDFVSALGGIMEAEPEIAK